MTKIMLALTLCSAVALPALAHDNGDAACAPSGSASGESVYYTPSQNTVNNTNTIRRDETSNVSSAPARTRIVRHDQSAAENRRLWLQTHTPSGMILGNMSGAAGNSSLAYMHGTANPYGRVTFDNDEGPSARADSWENSNRSTAYDTSEDEF